MICKISTGGSFKGLFKYLLRDKDSETTHRIAFVHAENLISSDGEHAWRQMAWTAKQSERLKMASGAPGSGRKLTKPVFHYSLAWHPNEKPSQAEMLKAAKKSLDALGLAEHEIFIVGHRDTQMRHLHVIANRVHPVTGRAAYTGRSKLILSDFARRHEKEMGMTCCPQREINHQKRMEGQKIAPYGDQVIVRAWQQSDTGHGFAACLREENYHLAQGRGGKRLVVVTRYGQTINPTRHLEGVRAKNLRKRFEDLDISKLPDASLLSRAITVENRKRYKESLRYDEKVSQEQNRTQTRHIEQQQRASTYYDNRLQEKQAELNRHYRLDEQKSKIAALRQKVSRPHWLERMFGISKRNAAQLHALEMSYKNAEWRTKEQLDGILTERKQSLAELERKQKAEQIKLLQAAQTQKPKSYIDEAERAKMSEFFHQRRARNQKAMSKEME